MKYRCPRCAGVIQAGSKWIPKDGSISPHERDGQAMDTEAPCTTPVVVHCCQVLGCRTDEDRPKRVDCERFLLTDSTLFINYYPFIGSPPMLRFCEGKAPTSNIRCSVPSKQCEQSFQLLKLFILTSVRKASKRHHAPEKQENVESQGLLGPTWLLMLVMTYSQS